jgi:cell division protease FtsH
VSQGEGSRGALARLRAWWSFADRQSDRTALRVLVGGLAALMVAVVAGLLFLLPRTAGRSVSLDTLNALVAGKRVDTATVLAEDDRLAVRLHPVTPPSPGAPGPGRASVPGVPDGAGRVWTAVPQDGQTALQDRLVGAGAHVSIDEQPLKHVVRFFLTFLVPVLTLADLFGLLLLRKGGDSGIGDILSFGAVGDSARARETAVTFKDVGGCPEALEELTEVRDYLRDPGRYRQLGAQPPKGLLLFGPPGCGKTLLARAVAGEAGVPFFSVAGAEFVESLVGVGAARVRDLFRRVREAAPAIVFIDELDAAARRRMTGGGTGGADEREQTLNQLLIEMDGFDVTSGIVVIGATNRPDILDPALMRPGRFDRHVILEPPDAEGRHRILQIHAAGKPLASDVDLWRLAARTPGFTGADLANVINDAALLAIRRSRLQIGVTELNEAVERVVAGPQRRGQLLTDDERRRAAVHETGHVVVAASAGRAGEIHRLSVLARNRNLAATTFAEREAALLSSTELLQQLDMTVAGVAAERVVYGEMSTGGEDDLERSSTLARDMVARYGMSETLGPVRLLAPASGGFLGDETPLADLSTATLREVEEEVRRLVDSAIGRAEALCSEHRTHLDRIASELVELEILEEGDLDDSLAPLLAALQRRRPTRSNGRKVAAAKSES